MTEPNQAVISRLSADFNSLSGQFARVSSELLELGTVLARSSQAEPTHRPAAEAAAAPEAVAPEAAVQPHTQPSPNPQPPRGAQTPRPPQYPRPGMPAGSYVPGRAHQVPPQQVPPQYPSWMMPQPPTTLMQPTAQFQNPGGTRPAAQGPAPQGPAAQSPAAHSAAAQHPGGQNLAAATAAHYRSALQNPAGPPPPATPSLWQRMTADPGGGLIGKILAVAGVAVTLIGVVMMLVLAAQAGILRPEIRVGAGAGLAVALVVIAMRMSSRPGGRVGAIALSATGIAAAYLNVVAVTRFYDWLPDYGGLLLAAAVTFGGLLLARRWDSQHLGLLVLIPVFILAPVLTDGASLLLIGFMLAMSIAAFPIQLGKDWPLLHAVRVVASTSVLTLWICTIAWDGGSHLALTAVAIAVNAVFGVASSAVLLRTAALPHLGALLGCVTVIPVLLSPIALSRPVSAGLIAGASLALLALAALDRSLPAVSRHIYASTSAAAAVIAVVVAFEGAVVAPVLLAMSTVVAVGARRDPVARLIAVVIGLIGGMAFLVICSPADVVEAPTIDGGQAISVIVGSVLLIAAVWTNFWAWYRSSSTRPSADNVQAFGILSALISLYALTALTVTAGVALGGPDGGFLGGHVAATICWMVVAATLLIVSVSIARGHKSFGGLSRNMAVGAGLGLTAAAVAKLFLFDLATLDGIFRVTVFIVVGLILLAVGAGYARALGQGAAEPGRPDSEPAPARH